MLASFLVISPNSRLKILAFEADDKAPDLIIGCVSGDNLYPSDDCYKRPDGNYHIGSGAFEMCRRNGLQLEIIE